MIDDCRSGSPVPAECKEGISLNLGGNTDRLFALSKKLRVFF